MSGFGDSLTKIYMNPKCSCRNCNGHIEFAIVDSGRTVECPHCGIETILFTPPEKPLKASAPLAPKNPFPLTRLFYISLALFFAVLIPYSTYYAVKNEIFTIYNIWQVLIGLSLLGSIILLYWLFPSKKYFFAEPLVAYIEKGNLFSNLFAILLLVFGFIAGCLALLAWFGLWGVIIHQHWNQVAGSVLFQFIFLGSVAQFVGDFRMISGIHTCF